MTLLDINNLIDELEASDTSLSNIRNLASLYIVKTQFLGSDKYQSFVSGALLPSYNRYIENKKQFQLHDTSADSVMEVFTILCAEIEEFLHTLYSNTDIPEERQQLNDLLKKLQENF